MSKCGTYAGYQRHVYYHQKPCLDCTEANAIYNRRYRAQRAFLGGAFKFPATNIGGLINDFPSVGAIVALSFRESA